MPGKSTPSDTVGAKRKFLQNLAMTPVCEKSELKIYLEITFCLVYFARMDIQEKMERMDNQNMETVWKGLGNNILSSDNIENLIKFQTDGIFLSE